MCPGKMLLLKKVSFLPIARSCCLLNTPLLLLPPHVQDLSEAKGFAERFEFKTDFLQDVRQKLAQLAALLLEARVVLVVEETGLTASVRKKKLENCVSKIGDYAKQFDTPVRPLMLKTLLTMALQRVTNP